MKEQERKKTTNKKHKQSAETNAQTRVSKMTFTGETEKETEEETEKETEKERKKEMVANGKATESGKRVKIVWRQQTRK